MCCWIELLAEPDDAMHTDAVNVFFRGACLCSLDFRECASLALGTSERKREHAKT